jgi:putative membrane protein
MLTFTRFLLFWFSATLALWIVDAIFDGLAFDAMESLLLSGLVLALVNITIKPLLLLITLPITLLSFGLAIPLLNGAVLLGISMLVPGFEISGFWMGVGCALAVSVVSMLINIATGQTAVHTRMHRFGPGTPKDPDVIDVDAREKNQRRD